jgi:hypothetical protein
MNVKGMTKESRTAADASRRPPNARVFTRRALVGVP